MFLEKLLPSEGMYCVALLLQGGKFKHYFYEDLDAAEQQLVNLDSAGNTVYIAQATFHKERIVEAQAHNKKLPRGYAATDRKKERSQANAVFLKNFFLDIDCGDKWPLKTQREGVDELKKFIADTGLPFPAVVSSGNGLYAHWILETAIPAEQWKAIAGLLKKVVAHYSPKLGGDASRTSDSASVLRAPGTTNRKPGKEEKQVLLRKDMEPVSLDEFTGPLSKAAGKAKINRDILLPPKQNKDVNAEFFVHTDIPGDAGRVADKCAQVGAMRSTGGDISEPLWYACIGILLHCEDGDATIHHWSQGHTEYAPSETNAKILQWQNSGAGPSTCAFIGMLNPPGCIGCPHNGNIKSPIVLGRPEPKALELPEEQIAAPDGFRRGADGLFVEIDGRWIRFYDQDLYIDRLAYDQSLDYEVMTIKHKLPHEGEMECTLRSSIVTEQKALITALYDNHIKVVGAKEKMYMAAYLESYQAKLQRTRRMTTLVAQMGWNTKHANDTVFVLGKKIFHADGRVEDASMAHNVPDAASAFRSEGSLEKWTEATRILNKPGMEPYAFALLAGGFGAPLMKFTGYSGAIIAMVGGSGCGKTLMLRMALSVWGYHDDLILLRADTAMSVMSRLGVYGTLPLAVDEVTNGDAMGLSDFIYQVTQGRERNRLGRDAKEKKHINGWNTLALTSANSSIVDKLSSVKHDASAEINRVFEYPVFEQSFFKDAVTEQLYWTINENFGCAGEKYAAWLVTHVETIKKDIAVLKARIDAQTGLSGEERFWGACVVVAIYGGLIAKKLGLIDFEISDVLSWAGNTVKGMRKDKKDLADDSVGIMGQFLDDHAANRIIVKGDGRAAKFCTIVEQPRGALYIRHEMDVGKVYISRAQFKTWLSRRFGSYTQVKNDLLKIGALVDPSRRKILSSGTFYTGAQQICWELNLNVPELRHAAANLVQTAKMLENDPLVTEDQKEFGIKGDRR